jgi:Family of unknown function (DUF6159)
VFLREFFKVKILTSITMNVFSRSWHITKLSFGAVKKDKEMLLFPLLGGIFSIAFLIALIFPMIIIPYNDEGTFENIYYLIMFAVYLGLSIIATFFNVCTVYTAKTRFEGGDATFGDSIKFGFSKFGLICYWGLLSATVGIILLIIRNLGKSKGGKAVAGITSSILGAAWGILTIFVVPVLVYEDLSPVPAVKRSTKILSKTWGESIVRHFGFGFVQFLVILLGIVIAGLILYLGIVASSIGLIIAAIMFFLIYLLIVVLVFNCATQVYNTALYIYATTGTSPAGFDQNSMSGTFKEKVYSR